MSDKLFKDHGKSASAASDNDDGEIDYVAHYTRDGEIDIKQLAKGKYHADERIAQYEKEQADLRAELDKRLTYENLLAKIDASGRTPSDKVSKTDNSSNAESEEKETRSHEDNSKRLSPGEIEEMVRNTISKEATRSSMASNISQVKQALTATWGANYERTLLQKASELGLTPEYMENLAANSPKALLTLVGASTQASKPTSSLPPMTSVNGSASNQSKNLEPGTFNFYEKLRKEDPRTYFSPRVQNEMMKNAKEKGDAFYR